jgi:hypothetical protein
VAGYVAAESPVEVIEPGGCFFWKNRMVGWWFFGWWKRRGGVDALMSSLQALRGKHGLWEPPHVNHEARQNAKGVWTRVIVL